LKSDQNNDVLHPEQYNFFFIISRSFLLRMKNVADRNRTENQNTHFILNNVFLEKRAVCEIKLQSLIEPDRPQMTIWPMCIACWIPNARNKHTHNT